METQAAAFLGAGIATIGIGGAAIGVGMIFSSFLSGVLRNPSAAAEGLGIFAFVVALILIFVAK
jgi:F-type H+-transporting ATPase subunit c